MICILFSERIFLMKQNRLFSLLMSAFLLLVGFKNFAMEEEQGEEVGEIMVEGVTRGALEILTAWGFEDYRTHDDLKKTAELGKYDTGSDVDYEKAYYEVMCAVDIMKYDNQRLHKVLKNKRVIRAVRHYIYDESKNNVLYIPSFVRRDDVFEESCAKKASGDDVMFVQGNGWGLHLNARKQLNFYNIFEACKGIKIDPIGKLSQATMPRGVTDGSFRSLMKYDNIKDHYDESKDACKAAVNKQRSSDVGDEEKSSDEGRAYYELMHAVDMLDYNDRKLRESALVSEEIYKEAAVYYEKNKDKEGFVKPSFLVIGDRKRFASYKKYEIFKFFLERLDKEIISTELCKEGRFLGFHPYQLVMSNDGKKVMDFDPCSKGGAVIVYNEKGTPELNYRSSDEKGSLLACGMSSDGNVLVTARKNHYDVEISRIKTDGPYGEEEGLFVLSDSDNLNCKEASSIQFTGDGSKVLVNIAGCIPCVIDMKKLDAKEETCIEEVYMPGCDDYKVYKNIMTMNSRGDIAAMLWKRSERVQKMHVALKNKRYFETTYGFNDEKGEEKRDFSWGNALCLDDSASCLLKIENGKAYMAAFGVADEIADNEDLYVSAAMSPDGRYAYLGGQNGSLRAYDTRYGITNILIPSTDEATNGKAGLGIIALGANNDKVAAGRYNKRIELCDISGLRERTNQLAALPEESLKILERAYKETSRPVTISSIYSTLSPWMKDIAKSELNARTGWGPRSTWDFMKNPKVKPYYKYETGVVYTALTAATVGGAYLGGKYLKDNYLS